MKKLNSNTFTALLVNSKFDVFISSASFEDRCFIIPKLVAQNQSNLFALIFHNANEVIKIVDNAKLVIGLFEGKKSSVRLNSDNPVDIFEKVLSALDSKSNLVGKPNLLIDITTFTHETLLILLRVLDFKRGDFGKITICYVGSSEYSIQEEDDEKKWLSKGIKQIRTIVGYSGFTDPTRPNHLIILFGFESARTRKLIDEYEYDLITLGFADVENSIQTNHQKINYERHKQLLAIFPNARKFKFSLIDALTAKNQILDYILENDLSNYNTVLAPMNNKLSTIGAGLAAIQNENIQLTYAKARLYNVAGYSSANEDIYIGEIL